MIPFESNPFAPKNWANLVDLGTQAALGIERLFIERENLLDKSFTLDEMLGTGVNCFVESLKVAF